MNVEAAAHAILHFTAEHPACAGRVRTARLVGGRTVPIEIDPRRMQRYAVCEDAPIRDCVALVDALIDGGLISSTGGARPTLVLTRAGHRALDALDATPV